MDLRYEWKILEKFKKYRKMLKSLKKVDES